jgi:hypothetical protein
LVLAALGGIVDLLNLVTSVERDRPNPKKIFFISRIPRLHFRPWGRIVKLSKKRSTPMKTTPGGGVIPKE